MRILLAFLLAFNGYLPAFSQTSGGVISASNIEGLDVEKNYILNGGGEKNTKGWSEFDDGAVARPIDGTGSTAANLTFAVTSTNPLEDRGSFLLSKAAADAQGEGVSYDFKTPRAKRGDRQCIFFDYEITSGTFTAGSDTTDSDLIAYIYDKDAGQLIEPENFKLFSITQDKFGGCFSPFNVASDDYRLILHVANANANAWTMKIDNVKVGARNTPRGPPVTDWQSYTPTVSADSGTLTNFSVTGRWRQVGDSIEVEAKLEFTGNPAASGPWTGPNISIPAGLTFDTTKINSSFNGLSIISDASPVTFYSAYALRKSTTSFGPTQPSVTTHTGTAPTVMEAISNTYPMTWASGDVFNISFRGPIQGWSSNTQMSSDIVWTDDVGSVHAFAVPDTVVPDGYLLCNGQAVSRATYYELFKKIGTTHGSGDGSTTFNLPDYRGRFLRGVSGGTGRDPDAASRTAMASGGNTGNNVGSVQGDQFRSHKHDLFYGISGSFEPVPTINGNANDNSGVSIMNTASIGNAGGNETRPLNAYVNYYIKWTRTAAPNITAPPLVSASYNTSTARTINNTSPTILYENKGWDSHNAYNTSTGEFTAPVAGYYSVQIFFRTLDHTGGISNAVIAGIAVNGTFITNVSGVRRQTTSTTQLEANGSVLTPLKAGDKLTITIYSDVSTTLLSGSPRANYFTIQRMN